MESTLLCVYTPEITEMKKMENLIRNPILNSLVLHKHMHMKEISEVLY